MPKTKYLEDTMEARRVAEAAVDAYMRLAWRDACTPEEVATWSDEEREEATVDEKHLKRWVVVGAYEPMFTDPSVGPNAVYLVSSSTGVTPDMAIGMLSIGSDFFG